MIANAWKAVAWWQGLQPDPDRGIPGDRGALARLRRCAVVVEAMQEAATMALFQRVEATGHGDLPNIALAAAVLAHVRADMPGTVTVARLMGPENMAEPQAAKLKPLRLRRLMEAEGPDERLIAFRRLVALAGNELPLRDLTLALLDWTEKRRQLWLYDYWNAGAPSPDADAQPAPLATPMTKDAVP